jgi:hypothetical protein
MSPTGRTAPPPETCRNEDRRSRLEAGGVGWAERRRVKLEKERSDWSLTRRERSGQAGPEGGGGGPSPPVGQA